MTVVAYRKTKNCPVKVEKTPVLQLRALALPISARAPRQGRPWNTRLFLFDHYHKEDAASVPTADPGYPPAIDAVAQRGGLGEP